VVFVAIVEGVLGAALQKLYVAYFRRDIANSIFHEVINGYSTVFSGAFFKSDLELALSQAVGRNMDWAQVNNLEELVEEQTKNLAASPLKAMVPIVCWTPKSKEGLALEEPDLAFPRSSMLPDFLAAIFH
jgi:hypothetical protein